MNNLEEFPTEDPIKMINQAMENILKSNSYNPEPKIVLSPWEFDLFKEYMQKRHPETFGPSIYDDYAFKDNLYKCMCIKEKIAMDFFKIES